MSHQFTLRAGEAFHLRGFCVPDSRSRGIIPRLNLHIFNHVKSEHDKTHHLTLVRTSNVTMQHTLAKMGWKVVGRAGSAEMLGVRFHYLLGREAFKETPRRIFLQRTKQVPNGVSDSPKGSE
jgi:hypothetical protein